MANILVCFEFCSLDCLDDMDFSECVVCNRLCHHSCVDDRYLTKNKHGFLCSDKCFMQLMPFCKFSNSVLAKSAVIEPSQIENKNTNPIIMPKRNVAKQHVSYDRFLDIQCSYLSPNDLCTSNTDIDFSIFHNNVRSLNKNFSSVMDIFNHCNELPHVLAITETKLNDNCTAPTLAGYEFEGFNSSSNSGGVGAYITNKLDYNVRNDLKMCLPHCEDMWLNIKLSNGNTIVVGIIYRHPGHNYTNFTDKLCDNK